MPQVDDTWVVDAIATLLGTAEAWEVEDLEIVAELVSFTRLHPGTVPGKWYADAFRRESGRDVVPGYDRSGQ